MFTANVRDSMSFFGDWSQRCRCCNLSKNYSFGQRSSLQKNILVLRICVFLLLVSLISVLGSASYFFLRLMELNNFNRMYDSIVGHLSYGLNVNLKNMFGTMKAANFIFGYAIENGYVGIVPNVSLPGFVPIMTTLGTLISAKTIGFVPLLTNKTRKGWESYAARHIEILQGPDSLRTSINGSWPVSRGVFANTPTGLKYSPGYVRDSTYPFIVTPIWQIAPMFSRAVMLDIHDYTKDETSVIDYVIQNKSYRFTDIMQLIEDSETRPSTILISPVTTVNDSKVIGLFDVPFHWDEIIKNSLRQATYGLICVLYTSSQMYTFEIKDETVRFLGSGDLHNTRFNRYKRDITSVLTTLTSSSAHNYHMILYPTDYLYSKYFTQMPVIVCATVVSVMMLTTCLIYLYDHCRLAREKKLEGTVESTARLTNMTLIELEAKKEYVRYISHEVRTPLNSLKIGLHVLEQELREHSPKAYIKNTIEDIKTSCDVALELVNEYLLFDKIISNNLILECTDLNILEVIEENLRPFHIQAYHKNITLSIQCNLSAEDTSGRNNIFADKHKFAQVIRNVLSNSLKFTPVNGDITVTLERRPVVHDSEIAALSSSSSCSDEIFTVSVKDSGPGISQEDQSKLFKEIVQFNSSTLQGGGGSGLGLVISKGIMTRHGGDITVYSEGEGFGSTFTISIPVKKNGLIPELHLQPQEQQLLHLEREYSSRNPITMFVPNISNKSISTEAHKETEPELSEPRVGLTSVKQDVSKNPDVNILVVDDATSSRKILCRMLCRSSDRYKCDEAIDGLDALNKILQHHSNSNGLGAYLGLSEQDPVKIDSAEKRKSYDIVFMDSMMPKMGGLETTKRLRDGGFRGLIIGTTGHVGSDVRDAFLKNGADELMTKPLEPTAIIRMIEDYHRARNQKENAEEEEEREEEEVKDHH